MINRFKICWACGTLAAAFIAVFETTALGQEVEDPSASVESASDLRPDLFGSEAAVPSAALEIEPETALALSAFVTAADPASVASTDRSTERSNREGLVDNRPRDVDGTNLTVVGLEAQSAPSAPQLRPNWMLAHFINVGQGDATLLEFPCAAVLIDTGGQTDQSYDSNKSLSRYLEAVFKRRPDLDRTINTVFLTHPHIDHTRGTTIFTSDSAPFKIAGLIANSKTSGSGSNEQNALVRYAIRKDIAVDLVDHDEITRLDGLTNTAIDSVRCSNVDPEIRVLWGTGKAEDHWSEEANNNSLIIRVDFGKSSFLFTGDLEDSGQPSFLRSYRSNPEIFDVDVYQVGHHGSRNGTTDALVAAMTPKVAVIGAGNPADQEPEWSAYVYGHPNLRAINALRHPVHGVTMRRPEVGVPVGIKGRNPFRGTPPVWRNEQLSHAIFSTGWDGDIVVAASAEGEIVIKTD